ncbi:hypothetical protein BCR36DRAFT_408009 [Piromyces finnis]|uniref:C2H2-type domain-containing protein n=1 Tax=Piromyces finnis TaxID=1754191 RepID=A0A1Y1VNP0_9FUNG|nr:hypothetical protein BCR36DRAFT_408009 [Piromyces finnis]|eukprot:ORX61024.1 hypothetical protein BCR36DRAFT_408009 [Piromyces finnis]
MISQYQINNELVDTTSTAYPSMYIQNQQNGQNQSGSTNSPQNPSSTQTPWDETTNAQSFLSNNSYLLARQQIPSTRTQLSSRSNSFHSQFSSSNTQTQQKFANYIAQQNYYLQNQNSNPSSITTQIVTYPQQIASIQQQIHSSSASNAKYPTMYTSPSTTATYSVPIQQQNLPSNHQMIYYHQNINKSDYMLNENLQIPTPIQSPQKHKYGTASQSSSQGITLPSITMLNEGSRTQNQSNSSSNTIINNPGNNSFSDNVNSESTSSSDTYSKNDINKQDSESTIRSIPVSPNSNPLDMYDQNFNSKPFRCPYPGCTKSYKNRNGLKYHTQHGHQQEEFYADLEVCKPFVCSVKGCNKRYKNSNGLKYHLEHSHNIVPTNNTNSSNSDDEGQNRIQQQLQQQQLQQQQLQQQQLQQQQYQQQQIQQQQYQQQQIQFQQQQQMQLQQQQYQQQYQQQFQFQQQQIQHPAFVQLPLVTEGPAYHTL